MYHSFFFFSSPFFNYIIGGFSFGIAYEILFAIVIGRLTVVFLYVYISPGGRGTG